MKIVKLMSRTRDLAASRPGNQVLRTHIVTTLFLIVTAFGSSDAAKNELLVPENTGCACPGSVLTFTCTAVGRGITLWEGTAFDCNEDGILLRHDLFDSGGIAGVCNNGAIVGQSIGVENECYTSQLNVTVSSVLNNRSVVCTHNGFEMNTIGNSTLTVIEDPLPPLNIRLEFHPVYKEGKLLFTWSVSIPDCATISYTISSDCGSCPGSTDATNAKCSDLEISSVPLNCSFNVHPVVCGITGEADNLIKLTLKVPNAPQVMITPIYSNDDKKLTNSILAIHHEPPYAVTDDIIATINTFQIVVQLKSVSNFTKSVNESACDPDNVNSLCEYTVDLFPEFCQPQTDIYVTVSATNMFGEGPSSAQSIVGCTNHFVTVEYDPITSIITCVFLNQLDTSVKSCSIQYGQCSSEMINRASANTTTDSATLNIEVSGSICYNVTASNGSHTVIVQGTVVGAQSVSQATTIIVVIIVVMLVITVVFVVIIVVIFVIKKKLRNKYGSVETHVMGDRCTKKMFSDNDLEHLKLKRLDENNRLIKVYDVEKDCSLKEFVENKGLAYMRGRAFYEFTNNVESISDNKELIFMSNVMPQESKQFRTPGVSANELRERNLMGERVFKPQLKKHTLFVQSTGSGTRHLKCDSKILYEQLVPHPLWCVDKEQFNKPEQVSKDSTLIEWCVEKELDYTERGIYLERSCIRKDDAKLDVILQDKDTEQFLTGPKAFSLDAEVLTEQRRVFVLINYNQSFILKKDSWILYRLVDDKQHETESVPPTQQEAKSVPLVRIKSEQFQTKKLEKKKTLLEFKKEHDLDSGGSNVFIQVGRFDLQNRKLLDIILMDKETGYFFTGPSAFSEVNKFMKSNAPDMTKWRWQAFALCDLESTVVLLKNSWVLYRVNNWKDSGLMPLDLEKKDIDRNKKFKRNDICREFDIDKEESDIFLECGCFEPDVCTLSDKIFDVVIMDKDSKKIFTGPFARSIAKKIKDHGEHCDRWRLFVIYTDNRKLTCTKDTCVLYQSLKGKSQEFHVWTVDEDNVRMYQFVEKKKETFEVGNAFYEFTQDEDLLYCKEIVLLPKDKGGSPVNMKLQSKDSVKSCEYVSFYGIPGVPGLGIKPAPYKKEKDSRIFIQSTSQGSRCLKKNDVILYKKKH